MKNTPQFRMAFENDSNLSMANVNRFGDEPIYLWPTNSKTSRL